MSFLSWPRAIGVVNFGSNSIYHIYIDSRTFLSRYGLNLLPVYAYLPKSRIIASHVIVLVMEWGSASCWSYHLFVDFTYGIASRNDLVRQWFSSIQLGYCNDHLENNLVRHVLFPTTASVTTCPIPCRYDGLYIGRLRLIRPMLRSWMTQRDLIRWLLSAAWTFTNSSN